MRQCDEDMVHIFWRPILSVIASGALPFIKREKKQKQRVRRKYREREKTERQIEYIYRKEK
jgi:hypothetical protein